MEALERLPRYEIAAPPRGKPERVKESIVRFKGYQNKVLVGESIAEMKYQPLKCSGLYRLIVVRKNISVQKGEQVLFDEIRYFFYITNRLDDPGEQIVSLANGRCHQENVIEQLKNGVNAMRMPVDDLLSNWACYGLCQEGDLLEQAFCSLWLCLLIGLAAQLFVFARDSSAAASGAVMCLKFSKRRIR